MAVACLNSLFKNMQKEAPDKWDIVIYPSKRLFEINFREIWEYRDLLYMFIMRDIITVYKQTVFGPIWYFVEPMLTMLVYIIIFSNIAKIPTDSIPPPLFYLAGIIMWNYFADSFTQTSDTFYQNSAIFGKVYFPRLIIPIAKIISAMIKFFIQSLLFLSVYIYFLSKGLEPKVNLAILLVPYFLLLMAGLGLGFGIIFTSLTAKYRDLKFLITFGVQLLMYATPIIYPVSIIPEKYQLLILANPLAPLIEGFKYAFLGAGKLTLYGILYSSCFTVIVLMAGIFIFNKIQKNFIDTI